MSDAQRPDSPAERWYRLADDDLAAARAILAATDVAPRVACFLAQQATEKALKAGLIALDVAFPKIHALTGLLAFYPLDRRPSIHEDDLDLIDPWVIDGRYAADLPPLPAAQAATIVETAERVVKAVQSLLDEIAGR